MINFEIENLSQLLHYLTTDTSQLVFQYQIYNSWPLKESK